MNNPGYRALIVRKNYNHLKDLIQKTREIYPLLFPTAKYYSSPSSLYWKFPSGSIISFGYFENITQCEEKLIGQEFSLVAIDEIGMYETDEVLRYCLSRLRNPIGLKCYLRASCNPSKFKWLREFFKINDKGESTKFDIEHELPDGAKTKTSVKYIQSKLTDNPHVGAEYMASLMNLNEQDRSALIQGIWSAYDLSDATVYKSEYQSLEKDNRITTVKYQSGYDVFAAFDLGMGDLTSVIIFQICGKEYQILESFEDNGKEIGYYIEQIKEKGYKNFKIILPHDASQRSIQTGISTFEHTQNMIGKENVIVLERHGIREGIDHVRRKFPYFYIDKTKNESLIDAIKCYEYSYNAKTDMYGDPKHDIHSHMADALRYMCAYIPEKPRATWTIGTHIPRTI